MLAECTRDSRTNGRDRLRQSPSLFEGGDFFCRRFTEDVVARYLRRMPTMTPPPLEILLQDGPLLAVNKPGGLLTVGVPSGIPTLVGQVQDFLKARYHKPGNVYLGVPHRLDRPVSGVVVFARNSKAAARLAEMFRDREVRKIYRAIIERPPESPEGELRDWLLKVPDKAHVEVVTPETPQAREAVLRYRVLQPVPALGDAVLVEIELLTGRMHQIRVQFSSRGWPVVGDVEYGATSALALPSFDDPRDAPIALHACELTLKHPVRYDSLTITAPLPASWGLELPSEHVSPA